MDRREFMIGATAVVASLSGCIGSAGGNEFAGATDPWSNSSDKEFPTGYVSTGFVTLQPNKYAQFSISSTLAFTLTFEADASAPLDYYLLEQTVFERYREQKSFSIFGPTSAEGKTNPSYSAEVPPGEYEFIFDNTVMGPTQSNGRVKCGYRLKRVA